jgi:hypothetical protein
LKKPATNAQEKFVRDFVVACTKGDEPGLF